MNFETQLRAFANIALLGEVPATLRSVSLQVEEKKLLFRAILERKAADEDIESLSCVATEIIASLSSEFTISEQILRSDDSLKDTELSIIVFRRREAEPDKSVSANAVTLPSVLGDASHARNSLLTLGDPDSAGGGKK